MTGRDEIRNSYLTDAKAAESQKLPNGGRSLIFMTLLVLAVFLFWSSVSEMDEITRGDGKVVPSSRIQEIQNLEGGIVSEIQVAEGVVVEKGQILFVMDDTRFSSNLAEQRAEKLALEARKQRLLAEISGDDFERKQHLFEKIPELLESEKQLFLSRQEELGSRQSTAMEQLQQNKNQLEELQAKRKLLADRKRLLKEELQMIQQMAAGGAASRAELLRTERGYLDTLGEQAITEKSIKRVKAAVRESESKLTEVELNFINQSRTELNETLAKINGLSATDGALSDRVDRTKVRSPVQGIVKSINVNTRGGVVQPGMSMMEIVPLNDTLQVEARIRPEDIGFLHPGQKAIVRFTAYDFTVYGGLEGQVQHISADTITDEEGKSYYLVRVETDKSNLDKTGDTRPVIPGMVATVDIITGKKTLLAYLLKPVLRAKQLAFTER
ncbi:HlyD family type I secretion periplasmic adaptor subunit [Endozoicomonas sp. OPT23]|uniref:HlyD family type I secretion periplasmic adaptor subunit n=1 Tax=Endozoicomonas sp. OPT23 TaxID=2072845 RepID=UPI00129A2B1B|nr:HlyD family type I secretion periplasmic adaptor subunit [Endozoicomonas sp. OPT23]MRI34739.1 HlyD family type I secretion periplasmic adaptor subunit [Endozoicomonas sp. OPT23]